MTQAQAAAIAKLQAFVSEKSMPDIIRDNGIAVRLSPAIAAVLLSFDVYGTQDPEFNALEAMRSADREQRRLWMQAKMRQVENGLSYMRTAMSILESVDK